MMEVLELLMAGSGRSKGSARSAGRKAAKLALDRVQLAAGHPPKPFRLAAERILKEQGKDQIAKKGRGRGDKQKLHHVLLQAHRAAFEAGIDAELSQEWEASNERLQQWSRRRLQEEGLALFDLKAEPAGALFSDRIFRFAMARRGEPMPEHAMSQGDIILLSQARPGESSLEGIVVDSSAKWMRVAVSASTAPHIRGGPWRLDLYADTVSSERCRQALHAFSQPQPELTPGQIQLRRVLLGAGLPQGLDLPSASRQAPSWALGNAARTILKPAFASLAKILEAGKLNRSQGEAIRAALGQTLTLWQGPPGTGKTRTLAHFLAVAKGMLPRGSIIACAASNVAVDNLVTALDALGVHVVRVGQPVKVAEALRGCTLEALVLQHPAGKAAADLRAKAALEKGTTGRIAFEQAMRLEEQATGAVLQSADVVASTCVGAGDPRLEGKTFRLCCLDEASQAVEPAALVPLLKGCEAALMVGDACQLPPTVISSQAEEAELKVSMFERLQAAGLVPLLLDIQYRMHPAIAAFPSRTFYRGALLSHPTPADRPAPAGFSWPKAHKPVAFVQSNGPERRTGTQGDIAAAASLANNTEARLVATIVSRLMAADPHLTSGAGIGVITPYSGQVTELRAQLQSIQTTAGPLADGALEVKTVDGFQGREKEVIVFSAVRCNVGRSVGFLADSRRLNVALTRAKRGLIVIGDGRTLSADIVWCKWLNWVKKEGLSI
ncbi:hypothetical protein WJX84_011464 [Apatococcus fuscideae]|uniref:AAA+ ATPase domain-containing protein n=1 Tax=Apatococcus fuscideae TaxID=2026836 RepID=A0AAW1T4K1_9CHLO